MTPRNLPKLLTAPVAALLLTALLVLGGCASEGTEAGAADAPLLGVHVAEADSAARYVERLEQAAALGARVIRMPVDWAQLEPQRGAFDDSYLSELRQRLSALDRLGLSAVVLFAQSPAWANGGRDPSFPPTADHRGDFGRALLRLIRALENHADRILAWEVWNEPNSIEFWPDHPDPRSGTHVLVPLAAAAEYAALLESAYDRIKAAYPRVTLLGGALASADTAYLRALFDAWPGRTPPMDGLSVHPYARVDERPGAHYGLAQYPEQCNEEDALSPPWCFAEGLLALRALLDDRALQGLPIWITEFGVASGAYWGEAGNEAEQARHLRQAVEWLYRQEEQGRLNIPAALWYRLIDEQAGLESGDRFGLYRENGQPKPAAGAFAELARR